MPNENIEQIELDIDERLQKIRYDILAHFTADRFSEADRQFFMACMRYAYSKGMADAFNDPEGLREWAKRNGFTFQMP